MPLFGPFFLAVVVFDDLDDCDAVDAADFVEFYGEADERLGETVAFFLPLVNLEAAEVAAYNGFETLGFCTRMRRKYSSKSSGRVSSDLPIT